MSRCHETAGLLFERPCEAAAIGHCGFCNRPVCGQHGRNIGAGRVSCITCARAGLRDQTHRGTFAHLADDPYFFWYFGVGTAAAAFTAADFALFDKGDPGLDASFGRDWEGS